MIHVRLPEASIVYSAHVVTKLKLFIRSVMIGLEDSFDRTLADLGQFIHSILVRVL